MPNVVFVTGVSCSGKTSVRDMLDGLVTTIDVDDPGTPNAGALAWLAWRAEELLWEAAETACNNDAPVVVTGLIQPHRVIESTALQEIGPNVSVHFVLLTVTKVQLRQRFKARLGSGYDPYVKFNWGMQPRLCAQVENQKNGWVVEPSRDIASVADLVHAVAHS